MAQYKFNGYACTKSRKEKIVFSTIPLDGEGSFISKANRGWQCVFCFFNDSTEFNTLENDMGVNNKVTLRVAD